MICKGCSHAVNRGDFIICEYWGKTVAQWGMGYKWKNIEECSARNVPGEASQ